MITVEVAGGSYWATQKTWLTDSLKSPVSLTALIDELGGQSEFRVWGLGDYRIEKHLLTHWLAGDGWGHFTVNMRFAEDRLRLYDRFVTDQSCLRLFINDLKLLG